MLNFNSPDRWIWVLAALPIVAFFLLRTQIRRRPVATLLFWEQVFQQKRPRALGTQLRHGGSLLLQLAFLGLLILALLDPLGAGQKNRTRQIVLVLDPSASMQAVDADGLRWDAALRAAQQEVTAMRAGDEIALLTAGSPAQVIVGMTEFGPSVREALRLLQPTDGSASIVPAINTARQLATDAERREIVLISDGCLADQTLKRIQAAPDVRLRRIGQPVANVGITRFQARRSLADPIGYAVLVEIVNHADAAQPHECRLTLERDEQLVDVIPLRLQPGQRWRKTLEYADANGGVLTASLDVDDALAVDNRAAALLPSRPPLPVNLVGESPNLFLSGGLSAIPRVQLTPSQQAITPRPAGGIAVFHRLVPAELPDGPLLFIDPQQDAPFWKLGRPVEQPVVAQQHAQSPLLAHVRLTNVTLPGARRLNMIADSTPLLTTTDGSVVMAALLDTSDPLATRRVVVLSAQLDDGDLPLRVAFPVMMTNVVNWLANESSSLQPAPAGGAGPSTAAGLGGEAGLGSKSEVDNLAAADESDLRPPLAAATAQAGGTAAREPTEQSMWFTLCLLALGLIVGEWVLYQRRMVG